MNTSDNLLARGYNSGDHAKVSMLEYFAVIQCTDRHVTAGSTCIHDMADSQLQPSRCMQVILLYTHNHPLL